MSIDSLLGARLKLWFEQSYNAGTGTFTKHSSSHASSTNLVQATSIVRPSLTATPSGFAAITFQATPIGNADALFGGTVGGLPGSYTGEYLFAFLINATNNSGLTQQIYRDDIDYSVSITGAGILTTTGGADSDSSIFGDWTRVIIVGNTTNTRMWINGVLQATTGTGSTFGGTAWSAGGAYDSFEVGVHNPDSGFESSALNGSLASLLWANDASVAFTTQDIADLDAELVLLVYAAPIQSTASGPSVGAPARGAGSWFDPDLPFQLAEFDGDGPGGSDPPGPWSHLDGYVAHWWFESYTPGTWTDEVGSADLTQATSNLQPTADTTPPGNVALSFDIVSGQEDILSTTSIDAPALTTSMQIGMDFYISTTNIQGIFVRLAGSTNDLYIGLEDGYFTVYGDFGYLSASSQLTVGWHHFVIDWRGVASEHRLYVDNYLEDTIAGENIDGEIADYDTLTIGYHDGDLTDGYAFKATSLFIAYNNLDFADEDALKSGAALKSYILEHPFSHYDGYLAHWWFENYKIESVAIAPEGFNLSQYVFDYSGPDWNGAVSDGTSGSGSNDLLDVGPEPINGTFLHVHPVADFQGGEQLNAEGTLATYLGNFGNYISGWALVKLDNSGGGYIWGVTNIFNIGIDSGTVVVTMNDAGIDPASVSRAISTGVWSLITFRYDNGQLMVGVNEVPGASGGGSVDNLTNYPLDDYSGTPVMGFNSGYGALDGQVAEFAITEDYISNQDFAKIIAHINEKYDLSISTEARMATWVDDVGYHNLYQTQTDFIPEIDSTPTDTVSVLFSGSDGDYIYSEVDGYFPANTTSAQFFGIFSIPETPVASGTYAIYLNACDAYFVFEASGDATYGLYILDPINKIDITTEMNAFAAGLHTYVLDIRGGADASSNPARFYVDNELIWEATTPFDIDPATFFQANNGFGDGNYYGGYAEEEDYETCSLGVAFKSSDFILDTDAAATHAILQTFIVNESPIAAIVNGISTTTANLLGTGVITSTTAGVSTTTANLLGSGALVSTVAGVSTTIAAILGAGAAASTIAGVSTITADLLGIGVIDSTIAGTSTTTANLLGNGVITSTVSGVSTITADLLGAGTIASTIAGTATVIATLDLMATINGVSTTTASLLGDGPIASTIDGVSTITSDLLGSGIIVSTISGVSTTTADLLGDGTLASTVAGTSTAIATLSLVAFINGVSTTVANLVGDGAIAATSTGVSTTTANLQGVADGVSTIASVSTTTANLLGDGAVVSTIAGISTTTADLVASGALNSTVNGIAAVVATLDLLATINSISTITANLVGAGAIASTIASISTTTADLVGAGEITSSIAGISTISAAILGLGLIDSTIAGTSTTTANLLGDGALVSTVASTAAVVATLDLFATINGTSTTVANLIGSGILAGTVAGVSTDSASLLGIGDMTATIAGVSTIVADLPSDGTLSAIISSTSTIVANLIGDGAGASTTNNISTVIADLVGSGVLASVTNSISTITANLNGTGDLASTVAGISTTVADVLGAGALVTTVAGTATVVATLDLFATINGTSTTTANLVASGSLVSTVAGTSTTSANLIGSAEAISTINGISTTVADLLATGLLAEVSTGSSTVLADLHGSGVLASTVAGVSTTIADLVGDGAIASIIDGVSTTVADCYDGTLGANDMVAFVHSTSTTSANLVGTGIVTSTSNSISTTTASITGYIPAASTISGLSTVSASILGEGAQASIINNISTIEANLIASGILESTINGISASTIDLTGEGAIASIIACVSTVVATPAISSTINSVSTVTATLGGLWVAASNVSGISTTAASLLGDGAATSTISNVSTITADLLGVGTIASTTTSTATVVGTFDLLATCSGTSTTTASLVGAGAIASTIVNLSDITATIFAPGLLASTISGNADIIATGSLLVEVFATINNVSVTVADLLATAILQSQISGIASVSGVLTDVANTAYMLGTSSVIASLSGIGSIDAVCEGTSAVISDLRWFAYASSTIVGTSFTRALLIDYLQDKAIIDVIGLQKSSLYLNPHPPTPFPLIKELPPAPPPPPPPTPPPPQSIPIIASGVSVGLRRGVALHKGTPPIISPPANEIIVSSNIKIN